ncbi:unnamed protein product [Adineta ricciae]|uniref:E3 ubiquitin-protein ligase CBL n=1 Tax=Adineta ricciae TaxID=249248 RepID=A0A814Y8W3_ADIRI|nr:unnamed protein product [Adineta ricciae]
MLFRKDPCGIICITLTYTMLIHCLYAILFVIIIPLLTESLFGTFNALIICTFITLSFISHARAAYSDPGFVPLPKKGIDFSDVKQNESNKHNNDGWTICNRCDTYRPARSHHCRICKRCVRKLDHHCPWINNCVGEFNQKYFILFLFYIGVTSVYVLSFIIWTLLTYPNKSDAQIIHSIILCIESCLFGLFVVAIFIDQVQSITSDRSIIDTLKSSESARSSPQALPPAKVLFRRVFGPDEIRLETFDISMAQAAASNLRRRILGSRQDSPATLPTQSTITTDLPSTLSITMNPTMSTAPHRSFARIDRRSIEKVWKQMDRIVKYCQMPKMNLKNSPPYMLDILPDLYQTLREIINNYDDRLHILNDIEYFRIFIDNLIEQCTKTIDCFKRAGHHMYDEQSTHRKYLTKLSLYFSHNLAELKSLFNRGIYEGEKFRLTKQEATEFWKSNFNERTIVPWEEFKEKLNRIHPIHTINEATALQNTIDLTNNNHVSIFEFDVFTRLFHPWSSLLTNWKLLAVTHPGFMAFMTYDEVKAILTDYIDKPGSYVFRLSCTRLGQWAIGYVTTQNTILQTIPQTKPLIQSLIDGEREGYYKYPDGKNIHIDLSSALRPTESDRILVSEEQYAIYCDMGTCFELCKICSVNNKDCKIQPCGHLICQSCLIAWQNQNSAKPPPLCPFCRGEIKGFESVVISPFDSSSTGNRKESSPNGSNEFDDQTLDANPNVQNLQSLATARPIYNDTTQQTNGSSIITDNTASTPPPIPPRPVNVKSNGIRASNDIVSKGTLPQRLQQLTPPVIPPPLHTNDVLLLPQRSFIKAQRPLSSASSSESLNDSLALLSTVSTDPTLSRQVSLTNGASNHAKAINHTASPLPDTTSGGMEQFRSIDDIRSRLTEECSQIEQIRIDAVLTLTNGLPLTKQYELSKTFLTQIQHEQISNTPPPPSSTSNTFVNGSFVNEFD